MKLNRVILVLGFILMCSSLSAQNFVLKDHWWQPDGTVHAVLHDSANHVVYLGGGFNSIDPPEPNGSKIDTAGIPFFGFANPNKKVLASVPDGEGGWFIGGDFTMVGDSIRNRVAHINSSGFVTNRISKNGFNGRVTSLVYSNDTLFAGGDFTEFGQFKRNGAVIDLTTGSLSNELGDFEWTVNVSITDGNGGWYVGGEFSYVNGQIRKGVAHLLSDGTLSTWNVSVNNTVHSLLLSNDTLFIGGEFTSLGGEARNNIGAVDTINGSAYSWNPNANDKVLSMTKVGGVLYVGGEFTSIGGLARNRLAAINSQGQVKSWNPNANGPINCIESYGTSIYVGGVFNQIGTLSRGSLAAIDTAGVISTWNPNCTGSIYSLRISGSKVFVGGQFYLIGGQNRNNVAQVSRTTGVVNSGWNPNPSGVINAIEISGTDVLIAGKFSTVSSQFREDVASINMTSGALNSWDPKVLNIYNFGVSTLSVHNNNVFIGGRFASIGKGTTRLCLAAINATTGTILNWNPSIVGSVHCLYKKNNHIYVGGQFTKVNNISRSNLVRISASNGSLLNFIPNVNGKVTQIEMYKDTLFVAGEFNQINSQSNQYLGAINTLTAQPLNISFAVNSNVYALYVSNNNLYVSGSFSSILGQSRKGLARINVNNRSLTNWNPGVTGVVYAIDANEENVLVGGSFTYIGIQDRENLAKIDLVSGNSTSWNPRTNGTVHSVSQVGLNSYVGGDFSSVGRITRNNVVALDTKTGRPTDWSPNPNGSVSTIVKSGNSIYMGGGFTKLGPVVYVGRIAKFNANTGAIVSFNFNVGGTVKKIHISNGIMYLGGSFVKVGNIFRRGIAAINLSSNTLTSFNPINSGFSHINDLTVSGSRLFFCGNFTSIGGVTRNYLAAVDKNTGVLDSWNPNTDNQPLCLTTADSILYIGGQFTSIGGQNRNYGASYNMNTDSLTNWEPSFNAHVYSMMINDSMIYAGGTFTQYGNNNVTALSETNRSNQNISDLRLGIKDSYYVNAIDEGNNEIFIGGNLRFLKTDLEVAFASISEPCSLSYGIDNQVACDRYTWINGVTYTSNNSTANYRLINQSGCDSIVTLNLTIKRSTYFNDTIVSCDSYTWINGVTYNFDNYSAKHVLTNIVGCDSVVTLKLTIPNTFTDTIVACDHYTWTNGVTYTSSNNTDTDTLINASGCDTIMYLNLTILNATQSTDNVSACYSYEWRNGETYTSSNSTVSDTLTNAVGCDSVIFLNLTIYDTSFAIDSVTACSSYTWINGQVYTASTNTEKDTLVNQFGCDSIVTLNLTINNTTFGTDTIQGCNSYTWIDGVTYDTNNYTAKDTIINQYGCDSIVTLNLTFLPITRDVDTVFSCSSYTWIDGVTYDSNNTSATHIIPNSFGCDSIISLHLTITRSYGVDTVNACLFHTWLNGVTYLSNNNTATHTLTNSNGCDSVVTLNLTMGYPTNSVDTVQVCDSLTWIDGNTYYIDNNSATFLMPGANSNGCDSIVRLELIILNSPETVYSVTACDSFVWRGNTYFSSTNSPRDTLVNSSGCDSVINLNLIIKNSSHKSEISITCDSLTWINGVTYFIDTTVSMIIPNMVGCDSIISLNLIINHSETRIDSVIAVNHFTWIDGNTYWTSNNTASMVFQNSQGCDSIVKLELRIELVEIGLHYQWPSLVAGATFGTFQWVKCPNYDIILGATDSVFTPSQNGSYAVIVTQNGFTDTSDCVPVTNVSIGEINLSNNINIYPNPVHDQVNIEITNWPTNGAHIVIRDINGKQVFVQEVEPISNKETISINTSKWAKGTYFIEVNDGVNLVVEKIVVQ